MRVRKHLWLTLLALLLTIPAFADDVTVSGNVNFSSLDGSSLDHDGAANGTFTVDDGDLTVHGTINCNDDGAGGNSACAMRFVVSGNMTVAAGGALYAENRTGDGSGGNITITTGGNLVLAGTAPGLAGAIVTSGSTDNTGAAGAITLNVGGTSTFNAGSVILGRFEGRQLRRDHRQRHRRDDGERPDRFRPEPHADRQHDLRPVHERAGRRTSAAARSSSSPPRPPNRTSSSAATSSRRVKRPAAASWPRRLRRRDPRPRRLGRPGWRQQRRDRPLGHLAPRRRPRSRRRRLAPRPDPHRRDQRRRQQLQRPHSRPHRRCRSSDPPPAAWPS